MTSVIQRAISILCCCALFTTPALAYAASQPDTAQSAVPTADSKEKAAEKPAGQEDGKKKAASDAEPECNN